MALFVGVWKEDFPVVILSEAKDLCVRWVSSFVWAGTRYSLYRMTGK